MLPIVYLKGAHNSSTYVYFQNNHSQINESDSVIHINIVIDHPNNSDMYIPFLLSSFSDAVEGVDYIFSDSLIFISAGDTVGVLTLQILDDDDFEQIEEVHIQLMSYDSIIVDGDPNHFIRIFDNDYPIGWDLNPSAYQNHMILYAKVNQFNSSENSSRQNTLPSFLGVFKDNICRGLTPAVNVNNQEVFPLMIFSNLNSESPINLRYYSSNLDTVYNLFDIINFSSGSVSGSINEPVDFYIDQGESLDNRYQFDIPNNFDLYDAYPNPFNPVTSIGFGVPNASEVTVTIYNLLGQEVRRLYSGYMEPGYKFVQWDGKDSFGAPGPSGMYVVLMQAQDFIDTKKIILIK